MDEIRVVVTGVGCISPVGSDTNSMMQALYAGESGIRLVQRFDASDLPTQVAAEVTDFDPTDYMDRKDARRADRYAQFAIAAAREAVEQAKLQGSDLDPNRIGVLIGSGIGGIETFETQYSTMLKRGPRKVSPFFIPMMISDMASGLVSMNHGFKGPNYCAVSACASAANAIGSAYLLIKANQADAIVTGGSEATITPMAMAGFCSMKAMSEQNDNPQGASRPFDAKRDGFVMGEGAGILVCERLDTALRRGAPILGEILGFGMTGDAHHMTAPAPEGEGAARAMQAALDMAAVAPEAVDYINAHGTSTPYNDRNETQAIKSVFGQHAYKLKVGSTKSMVGHLLGASGGLESVVSLAVLESGKLPPTTNQEQPDPECDLDFIPNKAVEFDVKYALSNSFGFGGHNVSILFKRYEKLAARDGLTGGATVMGIRDWLSRLRFASKDGQESLPIGEIPALSELENKLQYTFNDSELLRTALTHRSHVYRAGQERLQSNERLEFLGDSVLGLIVNEYLYRSFPERSEGELTKIKSLIVSRAVLGRAAEDLILGRHLILAPGEVDAGGRNRASILSDAFEAVLGAMYLDGGIDAVRAFIRRELLESLAETLSDHRLVNYKSLLQERIQAKLKTPPRYKVSSTSGPDHAKKFVVEVLVRGRILGRGEGNSKKVAEQRAAQEALHTIADDPEFKAEPA